MKPFFVSFFIFLCCCSFYSPSSHGTHLVCKATLDPDWRDILYREIDFRTKSNNGAFWLHHADLTAKDAPLDDPSLDRLQSWNGHFYPAFFIEDPEATVASAGWYAQGCLPPDLLNKLFNEDQLKQIGTARVQIGQIIERYAHYRQAIREYFEEYYTLLGRLEIAERVKPQFEKLRHNKEQTLEITYPVYRNGELQEETVQYARPAKFFADLKIVKAKIKKLEGSLFKLWSNRGIDELQKKQAEDRGRLQVILEELEFRKNDYNQRYPNQFTEEGEQAILYIRALLESVDIPFLKLRDKDSPPRFSLVAEQAITRELEELKKDYEGKLQAAEEIWNKEKEKLWIVNGWSRWKLRHQMLWYKSKVVEIESLLGQEVADPNELFLLTLSELEDPYEKGPQRAGHACLPAAISLSSTATCATTSFDPCRFPLIDLLVRYTYDRKLSIGALLDPHIRTTHLTRAQVLVIQSKLQVLLDRFKGEKRFGRSPRKDLDTQIEKITALLSRLPSPAKRMEFDEVLMNEISDVLEEEELLPKEYYQNWLKAQITALEGKYKWRYFMQRKGRLEKKTGNLFPLYTLLTDEMVRRFGINQVSPLAKITALFHGSTFAVLLTGGISFYSFFIDMAQSLFVTQSEIARTVDEKEYERRLERYIDGPFWSTYRDFKYWVLSWGYNPLDLEERFAPISPSLEKAQDLRRIADLRRQALEEVRLVKARTGTYGKWSKIADDVNRMGFMAQAGDPAQLRAHFIQFQKEKLAGPRFEEVRDALERYLENPSDASAIEDLQKREPSVIQDYQDVILLKEKLRQARQDSQKKMTLDEFVLDRISKVPAPK